MYEFLHSNFNLWTIAILAFTISLLTCTLIWQQRDVVYSYNKGTFKTGWDCVKFYFLHTTNATIFILLPVYFLTGETISFFDDWINCAAMLLFASLMCKWMKSNYQVDTLTFSKQFLGFSNNRNIHLSHTFLNELKQNRSADYLIERLMSSGISEVTTCFNELSPNSISLISHHIGKEERYNQVKNAFIQHGYNVSEVKISWLEKNSLRILLAITMKKPKALFYKVRGMKIVAS